MVMAIQEAASGMHDEGVGQQVCHSSAQESDKEMRECEAQAGPSVFFIRTAGAV